MSFCARSRIRLAALARLQPAHFGFQATTKAVQPDFNDSAEQADRYLTALIGEGTNRELRNAYLRTGPIAIDYLCARSDVQFVPCGKHPDYRSNMPGAALAGRAIVPEPFDGRLLDRDFRRVRPPVPEFMLFGGMMVGKVDISRLIGRFEFDLQFRLFDETVFALSRGPPTLRAGHAADDGQRARSAGCFTVCANATCRSCSMLQSSNSLATEAASKVRS